jgi:hypothetical protein
MKVLAVLTGDIVSSRSASSESVESAMDVLRHAAEDFGSTWSENLRFTRHRGDGWQVVVSDPRRVLHAMLILRARLIAAGLGLDTRISAGIGEVESLGSADLADATGRAFFVSGDHLDQAGKRLMLIAGDGIGVWQNAVLRLAEQVMHRWTPAQAEAAALSLLGDTTQEEIAGHLGITRQAVQLRLAASGVASLDEALHAFAKHDFTEAPST